MNTTESFEGSIGIDSFITPRKGNASSTMQTLPSFHSLQYSDVSQNHTLGLQTISKLLTYNSNQLQEKSNIKFAPVAQEDDANLYESRQNYLIDLQKWFLPLYYLSKNQSDQIKQLNYQIADQEKKNQAKKKYLRYQKTNIEESVERLRKEKEKMKKKQQKYFQEIKSQINDARNRIYDLQTEINEIQSIPVQKTQNKKNRRKHRNYQQPVFYVVGGYPGNQDHSHPNSAKNKHRNANERNGNHITYSSTNPLNYVQQIFKNSASSHNLVQNQCDPNKNVSNINPGNKNKQQNKMPIGVNMGDLLAQAIQKKMSTDNIQPQGNVGMKKKQSAASKNWQNGHQQKQIIDILQKSVGKNPDELRISKNNIKEEKESLPMRMTSSRIHRPKVQESKVNIMIDESSSQIGSRFSIQKKRKPQALSIKQSVIHLDVSQQGSHSKSREDSSDKSYTRKKSPTVNYSPTFKFNPEPTNESDIGFKLRKVTEQESDLVGSSGIKKQSNTNIKKHQKTPSRDFNVNEMVIDSENIKESQAGSLGKSRFNKKGKEQENKKVQKIITDPDDEDDEELFAINLLAVSKISKEKQLSQKLFASIQDDGQPIKSHSNILSKSKRYDAIRGTNAHKNKMSRIEEDLQQEEKQKDDERKRLTEGNYSLVLTKNGNSHVQIRKSGASYPINSN